MDLVVNSIKENYTFIDVREIMNCSDKSFDKIVTSTKYYINNWQTMCGNQLVIYAHGSNRIFINGKSFNHHYSEAINTISI